MSVSVEMNLIVVWGPLGCWLYGSTRAETFNISILVSSLTRCFTLPTFPAADPQSDLSCLLQDTAGSERYEAMSRIYYRGARAAIVCYGKPTLKIKAQVVTSICLCICTSSFLHQYECWVFVSSCCWRPNSAVFICCLLLLRPDGQQQLPASSFLGEGAAELRGGERELFSELHKHKQFRVLNKRLMPADIFFLDLNKKCEKEWL